MKSYRLPSRSLLGCLLALAVISLPARAQTSNTFEWTWVSGDSIDTQCGAGGCGTIPGVWGALGVPAAANTPGSRISALSWTDSKGNLWLFGGGGGIGCDEGGVCAYLDDLWEYNPSTQQWAWMAGTSGQGFYCPVYWTCGIAGVYGTLGTPAAGNTPGSRALSVNWTDGNGNLWLFGGETIDTNGHTETHNDLWEFNPSTNQWAWMGGSSTVPGCGANCGLPGMYGSFPALSVETNPGGRNGTTSWTDRNGDFWFFGGGGQDAYGNLGTLNDLWEYRPASAALPQTPLPTFSVPGGAYQGPQSISISSTVPGAVIYYSVNRAGVVTGPTLYSGPIFVDASQTTIQAVATAPGYSSSAPAAAAYTITPPVIASVYPGSATAGGPAFYLTLFGAGFSEGTVYWGATPLKAYLRSAQKLTVQVPAGFIAAAGTTVITVPSAAGVSSGFVYAVNSPPPVIGQLSPGTAHAGGPSFTLTVNGGNFTPDATVFWWSVPLKTTFVSASQLTAQVPSAYLGNPKVPVPVVVSTAGGQSSAASFVVLNR